MPTSGAIPAGARVEREVEFDFAAMESLRLALREPDFTTAGRVEAVINKRFGRRVAFMRDAGTVHLDLGSAKGRSPAHVIATIETYLFNPSARRGSLSINARARS